LPEADLGLPKPCAEAGSTAETVTTSRKVEDCGMRFATMEEGDGDRKPGSPSEKLLSSINRIYNEARRGSEH
jgi:hypothetical protein